MKQKGEVEDSTTLITLSELPEHNYGSMDMDGSPQKDRNVFSDGVTCVDFVLVWEEPMSQEKTDEPEDKSSSTTNVIHRKWRTEFLSRLQTAGLHQEKKEVVQGKTKTTYVLLSAPWNVLCYYAEEISLRVPLQVETSQESNWSENLLRKVHIPDILAQHVPNPPPVYYTCQFRSNKLERFLGHDNKDAFFKMTQRHQILYEILARTQFGALKRGEVGIARLVSENVFTATYPLHEGHYKMPNSPLNTDSLSMRQILYEYWARWGCWKKYQPLDHIREYFGEKVALYFAWLGFYTGWLLPAAIVGFLVSLFGIWLMVTDIPAHEICNNGDSIVMCPICNICSYWNLSSICYTYKAGLLFDNGGTVFFSIFMSLWAVTFLEYWKRSCSVLSHRWDCSEFEETEERPRPEFTAMAPMTVRNPITGAEEPHFPEISRFRRIVTGNMVIILMLAVVLMFLIAIILYRTILSIIIYNSKNEFFIFSAGRIASLTGSVLNLVVIMLLSKVYTRLAKVLTQWEMHRTQTKYEDAFILKVFIFQFVNFYSSPMYIAFFKGRFVGYPGNYNTLFGIRSEDCGASGCLIELAQELLVIMVGKQVINNVQEFVLPKFRVWWHKRKLHPAYSEKGANENDSLAPWEMDYRLLLCEGLFDEYLEMVLQFGFITIFVAACPLAPFFALVNNWVEVRLDAQKFVCEYRRPVAQRAQDIGIWFTILEVITYLAVISNAFLIAFTSDFLPRLYYRYTTEGTLKGYVDFTLSFAPKNFTNSDMQCRYRGFRDERGHHTPEYYNLLAIRLGFVIIFEHVVFLIGRMIDWMVPDVPEEVEIKIKRERYMAKEALAENQALEAAVESSGLRSRVKSERSTASPRDTVSPLPHVTAKDTSKDV
ncbi:anoctamin-7 [Tachysurus fulvidraco]|uniref:anoctamin-7 n=1 Tax=Tachysurus fulvidraco TaxID=1234273 RepID=UPI001FED30B0|nr:anoctamin-7 [Tachysurus fulvidraco]XP_027001447.2 anoctamin-7 [Tachysurus fulvidraco]